ncbi:zinc-binding dehydrogenase [Alkalicoccobacillus plakortidis]|uniref:Zinc-binding dehydrogenase n=1 Tax=Alkalicoccobacillus plakortidis TaxID=444060 RepID=A0ABT0XMZ8_9BACI|nr:zinc-binding dehydrogenase [Alkalicoccobacillus plakortidis]MCM2677197.1 zinc-binding dehydrogenase [Alkalicoccobacillus plakortidis]
MKALVKEELGFGNLTLLTVDEPAVREGQVKIEVKYAGICGSDLHTYEGNYKVNAPVTLGHEFSGVITEVASDVTELNVGDRVTSETTFYVCGECRYCQTGDFNLCNHRKGLGTQVNGGFAKYLVAKASSVHKLPDHVDYASASLTEPLACAHHAVKKATISPGDVAVVLGPGPIGLLTAQVAKAYGAKVIITGLDNDLTRLNKAEELGIDSVVNIQKENIHDIVNSFTNGYGADLIFECTGAVPAANMGLDLLAKKGQFVQVGIFPHAKIEIDFEKIIQKEIRVVGTRSQKSADWAPSLDMMNDGRVNAKALITHEFSIAEWDKGYEAIKSGEAIKVSLLPLDQN